MPRIWILVLKKVTCAWIVCIVGWKWAVFDAIIERTVAWVCFTGTAVVLAEDLAMKSGVCVRKNREWLLSIMAVALGGLDAVGLLGWNRVLQLDIVC